LDFQGILVRCGESCEVVVEPIHRLTGAIGKYKHTCFFFGAFVSENAAGQLKDIMPLRGRHPSMLAINDSKCFISAPRNDQRSTQTPVKLGCDAINEPA
jgi:hypothetical protein